jgi:hypothetical protein
MDSFTLWSSVLVGKGDWHEGNFRLQFDITSPSNGLLK